MDNPFQKFVAGDFVLIHGNGFFDKLIQYGEHFRFTHKESYWNHAALVADSNGGIIEAVGRGILLANIGKYAKDQVTYVHVEMSDEDRAETLAFAQSCVHSGYGFLGIVSAGLRALFGFTYYSGFSNQMICSELVGKSLEHGGKILQKDAINTSPADLARQFLV